MKYYTYILIDPESGVPFYIGKGTGDRMYRHEWKALGGIIPNGNNYLYNKIRVIVFSGYQIQYEVALRSDNESECLQLEKDLIFYLRSRGIHLCNLTGGGDGARPSLETLEKRSKALRGRVMDDSWKSRLSLSARMRWARYEATPEFKKEMSERSHRRWKKVKDEEAKTGIHISVFDFTPELRKKLSDGQKARIAREKAQGIVRKHHSPPHHKEAVSRASTERWIRYRETKRLAVPYHSQLFYRRSPIVYYSRQRISTEQIS